MVETSYSAVITDMLLQNIWRPSRKLPKRVRGALIGMLNLLTPAQWDHVFKKLNWVTPNKLHAFMPGEKIRKISGVLSQESEEEFYTF